MRVSILLFISFSVLFISSLFSPNLFAYELSIRKLDVNLYGTVYGYAFYEHYDKYSSDSNLATNKFIVEPSPESHVGLESSYKAVTFNFELSINPKEILRQLYVQYNFSDESFLRIGRSESIDSYDLSQVTNEMNALVNYGALAVHRKPMILFKTGSLQLAFATLQSDRFANFDEAVNRTNRIDNLYVPHFEIAYRLDGNGYELNFFGSVSYSSTTIVFSDIKRETYGSWVSHIGSGGGVDIGRFKFEYVAFGAVNAGLDEVLPNDRIKPRYSAERNRVDNVYSFGGAVNLGYNITEHVLLQLGLGSAVHKTEGFDNFDINLGTYINAFISLNDYFTVIPEIAYLDDMSDKEGNREGAKVYGGVMVMLKF